MFNMASVGKDPEGVCQGGETTDRTGQPQGQGPMSAGSSCHGEWEAVSEGAVQASRNVDELLVAASVGMR